MTLRQKQTLFVFLLAELFLYARGKGYSLTLAEGYIETPRAVAMANGNRVKAADRVHMLGSLHYIRLAQDLNLFVGDEWIKDGNHDAWIDLGTKWESFDPNCSWGGRFQDAGHFSLKHEGKA